MKTKKYFKKGFSLLELMVVIAIIAILVTIAMPSFNNSSQGNLYAQSALLHAKGFSEYVRDNYQSLYNQARTSSNSITTVTYSQISSNYNEGNVASTDMFQNTPCLVIQYSSTTKLLQIYMFYTNASNAVLHSSVISNAINNMGGLAGQYSSGSGVANMFKTWSLAAGSAVLTQTCSSQNIIPNSMVINMNLFMTQNIQQASTNFSSAITNSSLTRVTDNISGYSLNNSQNQNTMQANMYFYNSGKYNGIFTTENPSESTAAYITLGANTNLNGLYKTASESDLVFSNANAVTKSFIPTLKVAVGTSCTQAKLGTIALDATALTYSNSATGNVVSDVQCTNNSKLCPKFGNGGNYCYLPMVDYSLTIAATAQSSTFTCPSGSYLDINVPPIFNIQNQPLSTSLGTNCFWIYNDPVIVTYTTDSTGKFYTGFSANVYWANFYSACSVGSPAWKLFPVDVLSATCTNYPTY